MSLLNSLVTTPELNSRCLSKISSWGESAKEILISKMFLSKFHPLPPVTSGSDSIRTTREQMRSGSDSIWTTRQQTRSGSDSIRNTRQQDKWIWINSDYKTTNQKSIWFNLDYETTNQKWIWFISEYETTNQKWIWFNSDYERIKAKCTCISHVLIKPTQCSGNGFLLSVHILPHLFGHRTNSEMNQRFEGTCCFHLRCTMLAAREINGMWHSKGWGCSLEGGGGDESEQMEQLKVKWITLAWKGLHFWQKGAKDGPLGRR
jgi:hypothetical protein